MKDRRTNNRPLAFMLALTMALASFPATAPVAWAAAGRPTMEFASDENLVNPPDRSTATVITGQSIKIRETMPANLGYTPSRLLFQSKKEGLDIEADTNTGGGTSTAAAGTVIVHRPDNGVRIIDFTKTFNPDDPKQTNGQAGDPSKPGSVVYFIQSEYQASMNTGTVIEKPKGTGNGIGGTVESTNGSIIVAGNSSITLTCDGEETIDKAPSFTIGDTTGTFKRYDGGHATVQADGTTKGDDVAPNSTRDMVVLIEAKDGSNPIYLRLHPADRTAREVDAPTAADPDAKKTVYDNFVKDGTTFKISFVVESSDPAISLTVLTPQSAMEEIASSIAPSDGEKDTTYIRFADGDGMDWITKNFQIRRELERYGGKFTIDWEAIPVEETDPNNPPASQDIIDRVIKIGNKQNGWSGVQIDPQDEDVELYLVPHITYIDGNNAKLPMDEIGKDVPKKRLLVRGRGQLPHIEQISESYGRKNTTTNDFPDKVDFLVLDRPKVPTEKKMDAYRGGIDGYDPTLNGPYQYDLKLFMGESNGAADYATLELAGDTSSVILQTSQGSETPTEWKGEQIENKSKNIPGTEGEVNLRILAQRPPEHAGEQVVTLTIKFFIQGRNGTAEENRESTKTITLRIQDSTPSQESRLKNLEIRTQDGEVVDYGFDKDKKRYVGDDIVYLPYRATEITLTPFYMDPLANGKKTSIMITDANGNPAKNCKDTGQPIEVGNEEASQVISFADPSDLGQVYIITVTSPCLDPREDYWTTYTLHVIRNHPSKDSTLSELGLYYADDGNMTNNLITFNPAVDQDGKAVQTVYDVTVPYSTDLLRVKVKQNHRWAEVEVTPELETRTQYETTKEWLKGIKEKFRNLDPKPEDPADTGALILTVKVKSEDATRPDGVSTAANTTTYKVRIHREPPSHDSTLKSMTVTNAKDESQEYRPAFSPEQLVYNLDVPYSVKEIKLNLGPAFENVANIQVYQWRDGEPGNLLLDMRDGVDQNLPNQNNPLTFRPNAPSPALAVVDVTEEPTKTRGYHPFFIRVTPECEEDGLGGALNHTSLYELRVQRAEPSKENRLKDLTIQDQEGAQIKSFPFHPDETEYTLQVPYETEGVSFTATTQHEYATIVIRDGSVLTTINPYEAESGVQTKVFPLADAEKPKTFEIEIKPEDPKGESKIYKVTITRDPPSSDARLKALKTQNTSEFKPLFVSSKTEYTAKVAEGAEGVIIIPTANHPGATIKVDGIAVNSGSPTDLIELIEIKQTVKIEVTAQDRKTKKVYSIEFTNENLIEKTSNADLKRLSVNYGLITPEFKSSVTEYEVTATEQTWSVDIIPRLSDPYATMRVLNGTRELGDYNGNYALALEDGENNVTIEVTSPDKTVVKNYEIAIFRNEEDKLKNLTPLEAEDIDFEGSPNPILVKIDEYPRVGASVFNTLREDYPEKSIVFQGNDYSIRFDAANLNRTIPQTEIYDFRMSFDSPDEDDIFDIIEEREVNDDILDDVVLLYFSHHGSLPGPASFNLSLGRKYASETLYWHYYNRERERIDYYGALKSNTKGNIAVSIDHFSTYIISPIHRIAGSEDKNGVVDELGMVSNGKDLLGSGGKLNPDTGAAEERP